MTAVTGTVVVTGAARGIGRAIADRFAVDGAEVIMGDIVEPDRLGENQRWIRLDVISEQSCAEFASDCGPRVEILVNNAGIMLESSIEDQTVEQWDRMMAVNLRGPWLVTRALLPALKAGQGAVINIGSLEGFAANPLHTAYAASKGGVHSLTTAMAVDLGPAGVRCNAIAPGWIDTELNRAYLERQVDETERELESLHPVGHIGDPDDVAAVVAFLASAESRFISGQVLVVDGGRTAKLSLPTTLAPGSGG
jgi:meso-butanediol dehydrogenase/(S,S)-butanediol dehydrogenase/diacetyl reductase